MLHGDLPKRAEFVDPGIDRQHVDMPGLRLDGCVDAVEVGEVGDIALDRSNLNVRIEASQSMRRRSHE
jgi:hypothetical protein